MKQKRQGGRGGRKRPRMCVSTRRKLSLLVILLVQVEVCEGGQAWEGFIQIGGAAARDLGSGGKVS